MGNCCEPPNRIDHFLYVKTGDIKGNLSRVKLKATFEDINGKCSKELELDLHFGIDFERGRMDLFEAISLNEFQDVEKMEVWREEVEEKNEIEGQVPGIDWFCESIIVNNRHSERVFHFPLLRWIKPNEKYIIQVNDTSLPHQDSNPEQRGKELDLMREYYQYGQSAPDLPVQVSTLPPIEQFSDEYKCDIINTQFQILTKTGLSGLPSVPWESLEELLSIYVSDLPEPVGVEQWSNDLYFGAQRLTGCNPFMVKLCTDLPENIGVTAEMLRPFLEGWNLRQIIEAKRLFIVDLKILNNIHTLPGKKVCSPIGLFFVTGDKQFVPIAIQLFQNISPDNPVFLPNDPPFTWLLAKMWFNNADASVHQSIWHFCYTHLIMESISVSMHRTLSISHPVFKLLSPHFVFLPSVNARGLDQLLSENGWIDRTTSLGREGMFELMKRGMDEWKMEVHGTFPKELERRGLLDSRVLEDYGYRDDGMLIYKCIEKYVNKIIFKIYDSLNELNADSEIQNFIKELSLPRDDGGAGLKGMPGKTIKGKNYSYKQFKRPEEVAMLCTNVIFTCTVQHTCTNFPQYNEYAFPPNYPSVLYGEPPRDKSPRTEEDILNIIPDKATTLEIMSISKIFSTKPHKSLGEPEFQNQFQYNSVTAEKEFKDDLSIISEKIKEKNKIRNQINKYFFLDPQNVSNYISV